MIATTFALLLLGGLFVLAVICAGRGKPNPDFPERE